MESQLADLGRQQESPAAESPIPFNDLLVQWREIDAAVRRDFDDVFARSAFCLGPYVEAFENEIAAYLGVRHAVAVNSGTSSLHIALLAAGIGPGDEVLVPAQTFIATVWGALYVGATPVLCDVDEATATINLEDAERRVTARTKALLPVHLFGQPANMDGVAAFADRHKLTAIEDSAQAIGATWSGRRVGTLGRMGCFSFYPGKNLGGAGEGGLVVTDDPVLAERLRSLRNHGQRERYLHAELGFNYRMDGLQAVVLTHKLRRLEAWTERRRQLAALYQEALNGLPIEVPAIHHQDHVWHLFVIRTPMREALREHLRAAGIECGLHYPVPLHRQPCLGAFGIDAEAYPAADRWAREGLSLPLYYGMTDEQVLRVANTVRDFYEHG